MTPEVVAATAVASGNPGSILGAAIIVILLLIPLLIKLWNWSKEVGAQGALYAQLSEQVKEQKREIDKMYSERIALQNQILDLMLKVDQLERYEKSVDVLKKRLDEKDKVITERDNRIATLMQELLQMKDRVHNLEMRLKADEAAWCDICRQKNEGISDEQD
jgi:predicted  nucleic acid-binding Zn-ribbon protein